MPKLKWWQWTLVVCVGVGVVGALADPPKDTAGVVAKGPAYADPDAKFEPIAGKDIFAMTFADGADPAVLPELARTQCDKRAFCMVMGWTDPKYAARGFPMTDREVSREAFAYSLNRDTGHEEVNWDCKRWPQRSRDQCL